MSYLNEMLITDLENRVEELETALAQMLALLHEAKVAASGIKIGQLVRGKRGSCAGKLFRVVEIKTRWNPPWLAGNPQRADGTFGTAHRNLYGDWEIVEETK